MDLEESMATTEVAPLQLPCATPALTERYRMGQLLGSGGMADVFCADDLHLERAVAIKVLHDVHAMDSSGVERFRREAIALAGITSPNVARIHDAQLGAPRPYLVMEYINGVTVDEEVTRTGPLEPARVEAVLVQMLEALVAIHAKGLVHRDIKPSNVLVEPSGRVVLIDLGIAFDRRRSPLTAPGMAAGTPGYFVPDVEPGPASDIYQLGLLAVFMITGEDRACRADAVNLDVIAGAVPNHLAGVLQRALAVDPAERYQTAQSMMTDLRSTRSFATSELTVARDDRGNEREQKLTTEIAPADLRGLLADAGPPTRSNSDDFAQKRKTATPTDNHVACRRSQIRHRRARVHMPSIRVTTSGHDAVATDAASQCIVSWTHTPRSALSLAVLSIVAIATVVFGVYALVL